VALIYRKSGLLGVSGLSSDMRTLRASMAETFEWSYCVRRALTKFIRGKMKIRRNPLMAQTTATMIGKPLIESDRVEGTTVYDQQGNNLGSIKRPMIEKITGRVAYAVMSFGGFIGLGAEEHAVPWNKLTYDTRLGGYRTDITENQVRVRQRSPAIRSATGATGAT
jgi:hypothetical protein